MPSSSPPASLADLEPPDELAARRLLALLAPDTPSSDELDGGDAA